MSAIKMICWPVETLEMVADIGSGVTKGRKFNGAETVDVPYIRVANVQDGRLNLADVKTISIRPDEVAKYALLPGDLLMTEGGDPDKLGRSAIWNGEVEGCVHQNHVFRVRPHQDKVLPEYLCAVSSSSHGKGYFLSVAKRTTGIASINRTQLGRFPVPLPPLDEQRRIVDILSHAASIRRLRDEAQAKARAVIPALFVEMFGDPATNPKKWEVRKLSELGSLDRGKSKHRPRNAPILFGGAYPFIQTGDVANSGGVISAYTETYSDAGLAQSKLWPAGTLCVTIAANIAKTGILSFDACFPDSVVGFTPGSGATTRYVQYFLHFLQPYLEKSAPQLAQKNINLEILRDIDIPSPPVALQQEFAERVAEVEAISALNDRAAMAAEQMAQSLMAQMFGQSL